MYAHDVILHEDLEPFVEEFQAGVLDRVVMIILLHTNHGSSLGKPQERLLLIRLEEIADLLQAISITADQAMGLYCDAIAEARVHGS
jgi:hypothetical protein